MNCHSATGISVSTLGRIGGRLRFPQCAPDLLFDAWRLRRPNSGFDVAIQIFKSGNLSDTEKWVNFNHIVLQNPVYYAEMKKDIEVEVKVNKATGGPFPVEQAVDVVRDYMDAGTANNLWNRSIFDEAPIKIENLFLCELKNIQPMIVLNWHRTDLSGPTRRYIQYLTSNRSNSPLSRKRVTAEEQGDFRYVYDAVAGCYTEFIAQYNEADGPMSETESHLVYGEILGILQNLVILASRQVLCDRLRTVLNTCSLEGLEYLRTHEGLTAPIEANLIKAFGIRGHGTTVHSHALRLVDGSTGTQGRFPSFIAATSKLLSKGMANPMFKSYLSFVGRLPYALTRELLRAIDALFTSMLHCTPHKSVSVLGSDAARLAARLSERNSGIQYKHAHGADEPLSGYVLVSQWCDKVSKQISATNGSVRAVIVLTGPAVAIDGIIPDTIPEVHRYMVYPDSGGSIHGPPRVYRRACDIVIPHGRVPTRPSLRTSHNS